MADGPKVEEGVDVGWTDDSCGYVACKLGLVVGREPRAGGSIAVDRVDGDTEHEFDTGRCA